jgi:hypothetical protein
MLYGDKNEETQVLLRALETTIQPKFDLVELFAWTKRHEIIRVSAAILPSIRRYVGTVLQWSGFGTYITRSPPTEGKSPIIQELPSPPSPSSPASLPNRETKRLTRVLPVQHGTQGTQGTPERLIPLISPVSPIPHTPQVTSTTVRPSPSIPSITSNPTFLKNFFFGIQFTLDKPYNLSLAVTNEEVHDNVIVLRGFLHLPPSVPKQGRILPLSNILVFPICYTGTGFGSLKPIQQEFSLVKQTEQGTILHFQLALPLTLDMVTCE